MGKNILIVGASGDIGMAIANQLVIEGYQLLLHYHRNKQEVDRIITEYPTSIVAMIEADLSSQAGCKHFLNHLVFTIDGVVFASGRGEYGLFQNTDETVMDDMIQLHVKSPWMITKQVLPAMIKQQAGKFIFITSIWGEQGASNEVIYSSVKGSQNSFVKALAKEVAPSGISVNAISPGFINTKMNQHLLPGEKAEIFADIPMNRAGKPQEIADMVSFLLSNKSNYIQGEVINITGGW
ncbi:elongation factor P 5-aminopentanone reductase [Virgibacillus salexigens]|uniref:3-oxoacyl-[acyl-carrier-protein] reductase FabG n=2 Tax=Virgibacillus TaxID=84406 RepID=A0A024QDP1_9BACI|nr:MULTISPECIES: SDR family oxidoreductase [Virgibacillus]GGJ44613.1 putative oxidoreductase YmfI [Virgibacillus kapii]CDQ40051.1 3-oxoacyl-[acyl-carrier-protein] reductase FabG [Virgibacillus massiliensis]